MATAGRAVVFSGTTVAVGLLALIALPLPFLRSMGYGGMLIPLVATLGRRSRCCRSSSPRSARGWTAAACAGATAATASGSAGRRSSCAAAGWPRSSPSRSSARSSCAATNLHLGNADPDTIAKAGPAKQGLDALDGLGHRQRRDRARSRRSSPRRDAAQGGGRRRRGRRASMAPRARRPPTGAATGWPSSRRSRTQGDDTRPGRDTVAGRARRRPRRLAAGAGRRQRAAERRLHRRRLRLVPADDRR